VTERRYCPPLPQDEVGPPRKREYVLIALVAILMAFAHTKDYDPAVVTEAMANEVAPLVRPEKWASVVSAAMRGGQFVWVEPHTGASIGVFCDAEVLGKVGR
jgi:hypothetical protein